MPTKRAASVPRLLLALWSAPRSRSTAFERMMMERGDMAVLHEPFSHVIDFGATIVGRRRVSTETDLLAALQGLEGRTFFKDTTDFRYPELLTHKQFLRDTMHTFIIRHPQEVIASHARLNPRLECAEVGISRLHEIYAAVAEASGRRPLVVDSDDLLERPAETVAAYCRHVGIPFIAESLHWQPGTPAQWERTSRWHQGASDSAGFLRRSPGNQPLPALDGRLARYCEFHLPHYEELRKHRMLLA